MTSTQPSAVVKLVLADVDGTLVTKEKILTDRAMKSVFKLYDAGIRFTVTSGRPPLGMAMLIEPLKIHEPVAAFNGGVVTQPDLKTVVRQNFLDPEVVRQTVQIIGEHKLDAWVYTDKAWYIRNISAPHVAREQWTVKFPPVVTTSIESLVQNVAKVVGVGDDYDAVQRCESDLQRVLGSRASAARSQPYYVDVTHPNANKGQVVLMLCDLLKIPANEIATIGDMPNDVLMFKKSGVSIAMGNASPEVQREATYVTSSYEDEGFAKAMEDFILPKHAPK